MSLNQRKEKIYGAIETNSHITFIGFCKKIYSSEQEEIDILIDNNKIDTIIANKHIEEIEDKYEVFDTNGFCFEYEVPSKYIQNKHKIEFITKDNNQLLNSPSFTADENSPKYNEYFFSKNLQDEKYLKGLENLSKADFIGFIANSENLQNDQFIKYIKNIYQETDNLKISIFYFEDQEKQLAKKIFADILEDITFIVPKNIQDIANNITIWIRVNEPRTIMLLIEKYCKKINAFNFNLQLKKLKIRDCDSFGYDKLNLIFKMPEKFGLKEEDLVLHKNNIILITHKILFKNTIFENEIKNINKDMDLFYYSFFYILKKVLESSKLRTNYHMYSSKYRELSILGKI